MLHLYHLFQSLLDLVVVDLLETLLLVRVMVMHPPLDHIVLVVVVKDLMNGVLVQVVVLPLVEI